MTHILDGYLPAGPIQAPNRVGALALTATLKIHEESATHVPDPSGVYAVSIYRSIALTD